MPIGSISLAIRCGNAALRPELAGSGAPGCPGVWGMQPSGHYPRRGPERLFAAQPHTAHDARSKLYVNALFVACEKSASAYGKPEADFISHRPILPRAGLFDLTKPKLLSVPSPWLVSAGIGGWHQLESVAGIAAIRKGVMSDGPPGGSTARYSVRKARFANGIRHSHGGGRCFDVAVA